MEILPKKIRLFNQDIEIIIDNDYCNAKSVLGESDINHNKIRICSYFEGEDIPFQRQRHTLFHEIMHCIIFMIGQTTMYKNEIMVDNLGIAIEDLILNNFNKKKNE